MFEGARRAGGGVNEAMGESRAESLVGTWTRRWWASRASRASRASLASLPGGGEAHRDHLLKLGLDATADGVFDGLLGLVVEVVPPQAATGRPQGSDVGVGAHATHPSDRRTWSRSTRRTMEGSIA